MHSGMSQTFKSNNNFYRKAGTKMSGKFMDVKRIIIPTLTLIIVASQLMGCASVSQSELLQMINTGDEIEIEIASPRAEAEQGEATSILWEQLALLQSNPELRKAWDDTLSITMTDTGKNGMLYVDADGNNVNNNTLRVALHNREFQKAISDEAISIELANGALSQYADIEVDEEAKAIYAGINGYFNLLPDNLENYANPDSTLDRAEFMAMVMRAETPVDTDLKADEAFATAVGQNDLNIYAQALAEDSYLNLSDKSLNNMTYNGTISRAEAVYLLMNHYYADELASVNTKDAALNDATDGGDIASKQQFAGKDYATSYTLVYAIQNADKGCPTALYNALVLAESKGIISADTRWDEALTKTEAVELLVSVFMDEDGVPEFNSKQGLAKSESDKAMNPDYDNPEEYAAEDYYDTEETIAESSSGSGLSFNVDIIDVTAEGYKKDLEAGKISQETYDILMEYLEEAEALADENGDFSLDEVYEQTDANHTSDGSSGYTTSTEQSSYQPDYAVITHGDEGLGADGSTFGQGDYSGLEHIRSN